jgi:hypothetical protein
VIGTGPGNPFSGTFSRLPTGSPMPFGGFVAGAATIIRPGS